MKAPAIPTSIYASLPPSERIRAAVSASARGDTAELDTLRQTCPKRSFLITDPDYSEGMTKLLNLSVATSFDLHKMALDYTLEAAAGDPMEIHDTLVSMASVHAAWVSVLEERGIDPAEMTAASAPPHRVVGRLLELAKGREVPELMEEPIRMMREYLDA